MTATERTYDDELTRLIVAFVLLLASLAAWADVALTREYTYDLHGWPVKLDTKVIRGMVPVPTGPAVISPEYYAEAGVTKATPQLGTLFRERISYAGGKYPRYNGTPSARELGSGRYDYRYDALDRLTAAEFTPPAGSPADFSTAYTYDVLSRPKTIKRYGVVDVSGQTETFGVLDCMRMEYDGAHLSAVTSDVDAVEGRDFYGRTGYADGTYKDRITRSYNAAGRLTSDQGAFLGSVRYNTLGLPTMMSIASSSPEKAPRKERVYDATGCKLRQRETEYPGGVATLTEDHRYVGLFTFSADSLERMDFDGGYFDSAGKAHFLFTDWQGNVTLDVDADGNIDQHISYYPYGEPWREPKGQRQTLFAAKERQRGQLAGTYDFGPRGFNPIFLSWDSADNFANKYPWWSPWAYCGANPIRHTDTSGNIIIIKGEQIKYFVGDLQRAVGKSIKLTDVNGQVKYERTDPETQLEGTAARIAEAIDNEDITCEIETTDKASTSEGRLFIGGAFLGNEVSDGSNGSKSATGFQLVNPEVLRLASLKNGKQGQDAAHEVLECYEGAKEALSNGSGCKDPVNNKYYENAHNKSVPQSGPLSVEFLDENNKSLPSNKKEKAVNLKIKTGEFDLIKLKFQ